MRNLVSVLAFGLTMASSAVPLRVSDPITYIGKGSQFVAEGDFVVPANVFSMTVVKGEVLAKAPTMEEMRDKKFSHGYCRFHINKSPRTRVLPDGKALTVKGKANAGEALVFASEHVRAVNCSPPKGWRSSVGLLMHHLDGIFELQEAPAEVIGSKE